MFGVYTERRMRGRNILKLAEIFLEGEKILRNMGYPFQIRRKIMALHKAV
jgi:hypothetical protein